MYIKEFQDALDAVIAIDPTLKEVVDNNEFPQFKPSHERPGSFEYIIQSIISQQLSGLAARAIQNKFIGHFGSFPTPSQVLLADHETLRAVGLSNQKVKYVHGVAEAYKSGQLSDEILDNATPDEIVDHLVALKGIGAWSAQMFLLFYHGHMDVFSLGDLGVQRGFKNYMQRPGAEELKKTIVDHISLEDIRPWGTSKKALLKVPIPPECKHMAAVASRFKPYRSAFQLILWRISDTVVEIGKRPVGAKPKTTKAKTAKPETNEEKANKTKSIKAIGSANAGNEPAAKVKVTSRPAIDGNGVGGPSPKAKRARRAKVQ